ncbi:MAG: S10 family peptidase [Steroidobacteraceae bacterium]|jgi:carboxypeptidase C (cathepsin A)|nr:peptidase S10 [Gammaproteobacteria bacterium]
MPKFPIVVLAAVLSLSPPVAFSATETVSADKNGVDKKDDPSKKYEPKTFQSDYVGTFGGERISYRATASETVLKNDKDEDTAAMFTVSYVKKDVGDPRVRPVTFVFNGGPGSSSLWLHMGVFGPKRIVVPSDGSHAGAAPYRVEENALSILDVTDLVFIDPIGTGYSKALGNSKDEEFWGLREDAESIAEFIRIWVTRNGRWNSPKYIAGESYGTTRAARLVAALQGGFNGVSVNGVILLSSILDFHTADFGKGNNIPYVGYLPTYAAAAWYHGKVNPRPESLEAFVAEARAFAGNEYLVALLKGSALKGAERAAVVKKLARFTGLSETYIEQTDLRIDAFRFMKQLLRDEGKAIGRLDARYTGRDYDAAGETFDNDPSAYGIDGAYVASINDYLTRTLKVDFDRRYKVLDGAPGSKWKWTEGHGGWATYANVAPHLGTAMRENSDFRVYVANGYYDLATPFHATEITMADNGIDGSRVTMSYFEGGHMMYTHEPSLTRLSAEVRAFIKAGR